MEIITQSSSMTAKASDLRIARLNKTIGELMMRLQPFENEHAVAANQLTEVRQ
jgi:hypothetical protein